MKTLLIILLLAGMSFGQVSQSFIDDATRAFIELRASRELIDAQKAQINSQKAEIAAKDALIKSQNELVNLLTESGKIKDAEIKNLTAMKCNQTSFLFGAIKIKRCK